MTRIHPKLYLAPLQGFTDYRFRSAFASTGGFMDAAFAPFIDTQSFTQKDFKDILPENNKGIHLIPQILGNDSGVMIDVIKQMQALGYDHINWNLGCPYPMVTRKNMGAGLLCFPELIDQLLDKVMHHCDISLSVKMRLGLVHHDDWEKVIPVLNQYPLTEVIIHPRVASQLYQGIPDRKSFARAAARINHPVCYNGDIFSLQQYNDIVNELPMVSRYMLGRGLISNPLLTHEIITGIPASSQEISHHIDCLHDQLMYQFSMYSKDTATVMNTVKTYWQYFATVLPDKTREIKKVKKTRHMEDYLEACRAVFNPDTN